MMCVQLGHSTIILILIIPFSASSKSSKYDIFPVILEESSTFILSEYIVKIVEILLNKYVKTLYFQNVFIYRAFEQCHKVIDPENFYKACVYDVCHMGNATGCFSLGGYAQMCAEEFVCVDWRNLTNGQCRKK